MKLFLVLISLVVIVNAGSCPLSSWNSDLYYSSSEEAPQPESCTLYEKDSCCKRTFNIESTKNYYSNVGDSCEAILDLILCSTCSPQQSNFITGNVNDGFKLKVCKSFCSNLYYNCSSATFHDKRVDSYPDAESFCIAVLSNDKITAYTADGNCFGLGISLSPVVSIVVFLIAFATML